MKWGFRGLKFYAWRVGESVFFIAALFIPFALALGAWAHRNHKAELIQKCRIETENTQLDLQSVQVQKKLLDPLFTAHFSRESAGWVLIDAEFSKEKIQALGLSLSSLISAQRPSELSKFIGHNLKLIRLRDFDLWSLTRVSSDQIMIQLALPNAQTRQNTECSSVFFTSHGLIFSSKGTDLNAEQMQTIFSTTLKNPPVEPNTRLTFLIDPYWFADVTSLEEDFYAASLADTQVSFVYAKKVVLMTLFVAGIAFLLLVVLLTPRWYGEIRISQAFAETLNKIRNGDFTARPRLFTKGPYSAVEKELDELGPFLNLLKISGPAFSRFTGTWSEYKNLSEKQNVREVVAINLELSPLSEAVSGLSEVTHLMELITEAFSRFVMKNHGIVTSITPSRLEAVWGIKSESELDAPNATMAGLEIRIAMDEINRELISKSRSTIRYGMGLHRAPSQIMVIKSENSHDLSVIGDALYEAESLSRLAIETGESILISEVLATLVEPYFVLSRAKAPLRDVRIFSVNGYIDSSEKSILVKSK